MTMQVQNLPEFNPVAAGFPLTAQGYGPNETMPLGMGPYGPTGPYGDQMQSLGRYDYMMGLGQTGMADRFKLWVAENPYLAVGAGMLGGVALYYAWYQYQMRM